MKNFKVVALIGSLLLAGPNLAHAYFTFAEAEKSLVQPAAKVDVFFSGALSLSDPEFIRAYALSDACSLELGCLEATPLNTINFYSSVCSRCDPPTVFDRFFVSVLDSSAPGVYSGVLDYTIVRLGIEDRVFNLSYAYSVTVLPKAVAESIPEPSTLALLGISFAGLGLVSRRRHLKSATSVEG